MKKVTFLVLSLVAFALTANAQVNWGSLNADQKAIGGLVQDTLDHGQHWYEWETGNGGYFKDNFYKFPIMKAVWNFNSSRDNTSLTGADAEHLGSLQKATTQNRGLRVDGYDGNRKVGIAANGQVGKLDNYGGAGNPVIFSNVDDLRSFLSSPLLLAGETYGPNADGNGVDSLAAVVLALDKIGGPNSNRALAAYPGKYKKTAIRFVPNLASDSLKADITFSLIPLAPGNSGNTTNYKVVVSFIPNPLPDGVTIPHSNGDFVDSIGYGSDGVSVKNGVRRWEFPMISATANSTLADSVTFSLLQKTGLLLTDFSRKRLTIAVVGESTGDIVAGKYDPIVGIDNITLVDNINAYNPYNPANSRPWVNGYPYGVASVSLPETSTIAIDGTEQLTATLTSTFPTAETILPSTMSYADLAIHADSIANKNVSWESSKPAVASVVDGLVTGLTNGVANITVTTEDGGKTAVTVVTVGTGGAGIPDVANSTTKVIGQKGQIKISEAQAPVAVYSITGQKVAIVVQRDQVVPVPAGVYLVAEQGQPTVKVLVQ
ncbi:hypothetical protein AGMMS50239_01900 [Bacteroidia bacterium]|nr:hypothetical protein AGMMS50239_01900 [Bacteroidia bacterium]